MKTLRWVLLIFLGAIAPTSWGVTPPQPCLVSYAGVVSDAQLDALGAHLKKEAGDGALKPEVGRQFASREPYIDYLVDEGTFSARQMLGTDLLNVDWVEDRRMFFLLNRAVSLGDKVGRPIRVIEGYATDVLADRLRRGELPLERWAAAFSGLRKEPWTATVEKRGEKSFVVFRRGA